jgi:hypothetical protein
MTLVAYGRSKATTDVLKQLVTDVLKQLVTDVLKLLMKNSCEEVKR